MAVPSFGVAPALTCFQPVPAPRPNPFPLFLRFEVPYLFGKSGSSATSPRRAGDQHADREQQETQLFTGEAPVLPSSLDDQENEVLEPTTQYMRQR